MSEVDTSKKHAQTRKKLVQINAHGRLHFGFLDLNGNLGRKFLSLGVSLQGIKTTLTLQQHQRATTYKKLASVHKLGRVMLQKKYPKAESQLLDYSLIKTIPEHAGLGSGTQLALAVGQAISILYNLQLSPQKIAACYERGKRSGIGIGTFQHGGFILDAGRGSKTDIPPVLLHHHFPTEWPILLIFDKKMHGIHGHAEKKIFADIAPMKDKVAERLCRTTLTQIVPGVIEQDYAIFTQGIVTLQHAIGKHFVAAQKGLFTSKLVEAALQYCKNIGEFAQGQSSWGPTGFVILPDVEQATYLHEKISLQFPHLDFMLTAARNKPAFSRVKNKE